MDKMEDSLTLERKKKVDMENIVRERLGKLEAGLTQDRREKVDDTVKDRLSKLEEKMKESKDKVERMRQDKEKVRREESKKVMRDRLQLANKSIKYMDIDFERKTGNRRELVQKTVEYMKEDENFADRKRFDTLIRRTRIVLLGKETKFKSYKSKAIYTVPVLLECRTETDKLEVEEILRVAGWHASCHWPMECMEVVKEAREEIRKMGYTERTHYIKLRPEVREGRTKIKGEVKEKEGGRFRTVAFWEAPPADRTLWDSETMKPRVPGSRDW